MGKFQIPENPDFSIDLAEIGVERAIPSVFNNPIKRLLTNTAHLKVKADITDAHIANSDAHVSKEQKEAWTGKADNVLATPTQNGLMLSGDKSKIDSIATGAEVNQYAINNIRVGNVNVHSNAKEGQIILVPGSNVTISADNATKVITITANIPSSLPANGGHASTCDRATNANWADGAANANNANYANSAGTCNNANNANNATNANNAGAVRGFAFAVAIQAGVPGDGNALWAW